MRAEYVAHVVDADVIQSDFAKTFSQPCAPCRLAKRRRRNTSHLHLPVRQLRLLDAKPVESRTYLRGRRQTSHFLLQRECRPSSGKSGRGGFGLMAKYCVSLQRVEDKRDWQSGERGLRRVVTMCLREPSPLGAIIGRARRQQEITLANLMQFLPYVPQLQRGSWLQGRRCRAADRPAGWAQRSHRVPECCRARRLFASNCAYWTAPFSWPRDGSFGIDLRALRHGHSTGFADARLQFPIPIGIGHNRTGRSISGRGGQRERREKYDLAPHERWFVVNESALESYLLEFVDGCDRAGPFQRKTRSDGQKACDGRSGPETSAQTRRRS